MVNNVAVNKWVTESKQLKCFAFEGGYSLLSFSNLTFGFKDF